MDQVLDMKEGREMNMEMQMAQEPQQPEHTPLPWHEGETASNKLAIFSQASPIAIAEILTFPHHKNGQANAEFIVRAVNNHDALVEAATKVLRGLNERIARASATGDPVPLFDGIGELHNALSTAQEQS